MLLYFNTIKRLFTEEEFEKLINNQPLEDHDEYPLVKLEISHTSHPFYTGKMKLVDTAGRIDKFRSRYNKK